MRQRSAFCISMAAAALVLIMTSSALRAASSADRDQSGVAHGLAAGRVTFRQFCAPCHGADGKGRGPASGLLYKPPANLTQIRFRHGGLFPHDALASLLLAPTRDSVSPALPEQMMLWGPVFLSMDGEPSRARTRVENLLTFLESLQED